MSGMSGTSVSSALSGAIQCSATAVFGAETCTVSAFGIPIQLNDYSGNIFVPLLMAAVLAVVYRGLKRVIPDSVQLVFVPFLSLVVVFALTILVIGPLEYGSAVGWERPQHGLTRTCRSYSRSSSRCSTRFSCRSVCTGR